MALSMLPIQGTKVSADTQNSAYEIVMEPQLEYDYVYGYEGNYIKVANKGKTLIIEKLAYGDLQTKMEMK